MLTLINLHCSLLSTQQSNSKPRLIRATKYYYFPVCSNTRFLSKHHRWNYWDFHQLKKACVIHQWIFGIMHANRHSRPSFQGKVHYFCFNKLKSAKNKDCTLPQTTAINVLIPPYRPWRSLNSLLLGRWLLHHRDHRHVALPVVRCRLFFSDPDCCF